VTQESYAGYYRMVFFGFTHCRMICPMGMQTMDQVLRLLGKDAEKLNALFITTDPHRDTMEVMKRYVENWGDRIQGLSGSEEKVKAATKSFRLEAQKVEIRSEEDYQMDHPTLIYLMDKE